MRSIWIAEDDHGARFVYDELLAEDYRLSFFTTLEELRDRVKSVGETPDLIIADLKFPDGLFTEFMRSAIYGRVAKIPCLVVSSTDDCEVLKNCFEIGVVDYMVKPLRQNELLVKVERIMARHVRNADFPLELDFVNMEMRLPGASSVSLTPKELKILSVIHQPRGNLATRKEIFSAVWSKSRVGRKTLDTHMFNLRRKLKQIGLEILFHNPDKYTLDYSPEIKRSIQA